MLQHGLVVRRHPPTDTILYLSGSFHSFSDASEYNNPGEQQTQGQVPLDDSGLVNSVCYI